MFKNYFKMAWRNLMRHKVFSIINISGLALGMTCCILILLWVKDEVSFDRFHENIDELYMVYRTELYTGADNLTVPAHSGRLAPALEQNMPEVVHAVRVSQGGDELLSYGDKSIKVNGQYPDPEFFEVFSFPLLHGNAAQALQELKSVVLSDSVALKLFGSTEVVGKVVKLNNDESYKVTGVMQKVPKNSTLKFDFVIPYENYEARNQWLKEWNNNGILTFIQVEKDTDIPALDKKLKHFLSTQGDMDDELFLHAYSKQHLYSEFSKGKGESGLILYVRLFSVVAVFILLIACINFMNLATARSAKRAKEVGVRKAIGASKASLISQFMVESVLVSFLALFIALNLTGLLLPAFNSLTDKAVQLDLSNPELVMLLLGVALFTGIVSGSYPAFFLSAFDPAVVLKGTVKLNNKAVYLRKGLVVFQFMLSALLIVSTLVVYLQIEFIRNKNIGLQREHVVYVPIEGDLGARYETVKQELSSMPGIALVSASNQNPLSIGSNTSGASWNGKEPGDEVSIDVMNVEYSLLETLGIKIKEGRDFSKAFSTDTANYILNEEAVRVMQLQEPVGEWLDLWGTRGHIVGVVEDFQSRRMQVGIKPLIIRFAPSDVNLLYVRTMPGKTTEALASMETVLQKHNPAFPFDYHFLDDDFEQMYKSEAVIGRLTNYFAGIAIFISCLGLFGLALFTAEQRKKEIGVRKVLGASVSGIVLMLSKDFLKLVLLANLIALPLSWYLMNGWLSDYAYRTDLSWWIFAIAFAATLVIATLTLSFHAIKTAVANPVTSLRTE
ncbi:ABC transporter permease [Pontibacter diazotrophicus]|uniref:ABC transporter permease n=1 Tax=Pontibacter diazotrophicus TaxID=1400979 RepID=A0A3D8L7I9_9BACT|nr:ABC transporter permease [Pontibacter diazotrophicus]RDV13256.1 ABC transporter permease [Pontibacter diazotrophicus]